MLKGDAGAALLESYNAERIHGADENILNSSRTSGFMTPKSDFERMLRSAVLSLAADHPFARRMVNSGRLSAPCGYEACGFVAADTDGLPAETRPGRPASDAPLGQGWLLKHLGNGFTVLALNVEPPRAGLDTLHLPAAEIGPDLRKRYLGDAPAALYLIRPDQHIAGRWRTADTAALEAAHRLSMAGA